VKRAAVCTAFLALGVLGASACGSDSQPTQSTRPVFVDAGCDTVVFPECNFTTPGCPSCAPKCSVVESGNEYATACVPVSGTRSVGETCEREALGRDDCAPGNLCSSVALAGDATSTRVCRKLCTQAAQCTAPERCYQFSLNQPQVYGMCVPPCQPLDSDCGPGRHCIFVRDAAEIVFAMCDSHGDLAEGALCNAPQECSKGMACALQNGCRVYCDPAHPCADASRVCTPLNFAEFPGLGLCMPAA